MRKNSYISYDICETLAQNQAGVSELIDKTDNLIDSSITALNNLIPEGTIDLIIPSLPYYGRYIYMRDRICEVRDYFTEYSLGERIKRIEIYAQAVDSFLEELDRMERNPIWITRVSSVLGQSEKNIDRTDFYKKIAERRAYLRTRLHTLSHSLSTITDKSLDFSLLQEKLQLFTALDAYPNIPEDDEQATKLARMLDILEPLEKKLTDTLAIAQQPKRDPTFKTIIPTNKDNGTDDLYEIEHDSSYLQTDLSVEHEEDLDEFDTYESEPTENEPIDRIKEDNTSHEQINLGFYQLQRGDTFADILLGYTEAGTLPIMSEINAQDQRKLLRDVRRYFIHNPSLFSYIGIEEHVKELSDVTESANLSLDKLHDVCCLIAHQKDIIQLPETVFNDIARQLKSQSVASKAKPKTKRTTATSYDMETNTVSQAVAKFYKGDKQLFLEDVELWSHEALALRSHSITPLLSLEYQEWLNLVNDSNLRYNYLTENNIPLSVFQRFSDKVRRWRQSIPNTTTRDITQLSLLDIVSTAFVNEVLRDQVF